MRGTIRFLLEMVMVVASAAAIGAVILAVGMLPQVGLGVFLKFGGGPMLVPMACLLWLGVQRRKVPNEYGANPLAIALRYYVPVTVALLALEGGWYWHPFPRSQGWLLSWNRWSAIALFVGAHFLPDAWARYVAARRSGRSRPGSAKGSSGS